MSQHVLSLYVSGRTKASDGRPTTTLELLVTPSSSLLYVTFTLRYLALRTRDTHIYKPLILPFLEGVKSFWLLVLLSLILRLLASLPKMPKKGMPTVIMLQRQERIRKIHELRAKIKACFKAKRSIDQEKLIAECCMDWGTSRRTALEYLKILQAVMGFSIDNGIIKALPKQKRLKV